MLQGAFRSFRHEHYFNSKGTDTLMQDVFHFETPLGIFGKLANSVFLKSYMKNLLLQQNKVIQSVAQTEEWRKFLPH
jgi:ligand-binding SRPBCC domain-containing protein